MAEEEVAHLRRYLALQSMKLTPVQLIDSLQEAHRQFVAALTRLSVDTFYRPFENGEWSTAQILEHVRASTEQYAQGILSVILDGTQPNDVNGQLLPQQRDVSRDVLLAELQVVCTHLAESVHNVDPQTHLDMTWNHFELGPMHWREWLLFARVHLLNHARHMEQISHDMK